MDNASQSDLNIIRESVLHELKDVKAIYLFGSVARGTEKKGSDYDILIFVEKSPKNKVKTITNIRFDVEDKIKRRLEPFLMEVDDIRYASPILYEVYNNNRLLYGENILSRASEIVKKIKPHVKDGKIIHYHVKH